MPTEIRRPSAPIMKQPGAPDASPLGLIPLGIIATLGIVLHFAAYAVLDRSYAGELTPIVYGVAGGEVICDPETKPAELALPYD